MASTPHAVLPQEMKLSDPQTITITNPRNVISVYSNHFGITITMTDFTIHFLEVGQAPGLNGASTPTQEMRATVTLPMAAAEGLVQVMQQVAGQFHQAKLQHEKIKASAKK